MIVGIYKMHAKEINISRAYNYHFGNLVKARKKNK